MAQERNKNFNELHNSIKYLLSSCKDLQREATDIRQEFQELFDRCSAVHHCVKIKSCTTCND